jgi:NADPH-dependent curcumin reductase CurA
MSGSVNRQILLVEKPSGKLGPEHFKMVEGAMPEPKDGEALLRVRYISLDAANRAWMHGATYRSAVEANSVMAGGGIAEVVSSKAPGLAPGDIVFGDTGWQEFAAVPAKHLTKMPKLEPMTHLLSVFGIAGLTAYFGLLEIGKPKQGETVVVSAAAGSVGSIVGQIAKIRGCRVVGIAGGADKCNWLTSELGFDAAGRRGVQGVARGGAQGDRRLFRQCRRRHSRSLPAADEQLRPHRLLRRDLAI